MIAPPSPPSTPSLQPPSLPPPVLSINGDGDDFVIVNPTVSLPLPLLDDKQWTLERFVDFRTGYFKVYTPHAEALQAALAEGTQLKVLFSAYQTLLKSLQSNVRYLNTQEQFIKISKDLKEVYEGYQRWEEGLKDIYNQNWRLVEKVRQMRPMQLDASPLPTNQSTTVLAVTGMRSFIKSECQLYESHSTEVTEKERELNEIQKVLKQTKGELVELETYLSIVRGDDEEGGDEKVHALSTIGSLLLRFLDSLKNWRASVSVRKVSKSASASPKQKSLEMAQSGSYLSLSWLWGSSSPDNTGGKGSAGINLKQQFTNVPLRLLKLTASEKDPAVVVNIFSRGVWNSLLTPLNYVQNPLIFELSAQELAWKCYFQDTHKTLFELMTQALVEFHEPCLELQMFHDRLQNVKKSAAQNAIQAMLFDRELQRLLNRMNVVDSGSWNIDSNIKMLCVNLGVISKRMEGGRESVKIAYEALIDCREFLLNLINQGRDILRDIQKSDLQPKKKVLVVPDWIPQLEKELNDCDSNDVKAVGLSTSAQKLMLEYAQSQTERPSRVGTPEVITEAFQEIARLRTLSPLPADLSKRHAPLLTTFQRIIPSLNNRSQFDDKLRSFLAQMNPEAHFPHYKQIMLLRETANRTALEQSFKHEAMQLLRVQNEMKMLLKTMKYIQWESEQLALRPSQEIDDRLKQCLTILLNRYDVVKEQSQELRLLCSEVTEWVNATLKVYEKKMNQMPFYATHVRWNLRSEEGNALLKQTLEKMIAYLEFYKLQFEYIYEYQVLATGDNMAKALNVLIDRRDNTGGMLSSITLSQNPKHVINPFR